MKLEIDRGYDWLVLCIIVCLVLFLLGSRFVQPVVYYFSPPGIAIDAPASEATGIVPPAVAPSPEENAIPK